MLKMVKGKWAIVSKEKEKPLAYYDGEGKPDEEWVKKQEKRIQYFKNKKEEVIMKTFKEIINERLDDEGRDLGLTGINDEGLGEFQDAVQALLDASINKSKFEYYMTQTFYRSEDWTRDAKQVGKILEQIHKAVTKVSKMIDRW
tara:strand:- start:10726 stop:11157 length:432 start_codon:yes stop_codon:yes gene_type:complete